MAPQKEILLKLWEMVRWQNKVGIDYLSVQEYIVSWNSFPIIFLGGGEFVKFLS